MKKEKPNQNINVKRKRILKLGVLLFSTYRNRRKAIINDNK